MDKFNDILYLLAFFSLAGITGVAFYIWGQLWDRTGYRKKTRALTLSIGSHKRLANELRNETVVHRDVAEQYRDALDNREEYWLAVKKRWISEAERAKQIISQQEEIRTKHTISLKEANRKLMAIENDFQKTKHENEAQINALKMSQSEPEKLKSLENESKLLNKKFTTEIEAKKTKLVELKQNLKKRDEKLSKLENIILKKNNELNDLKRKLQQSSSLAEKLATASDELKAKERDYEAIKIDLKSRNESLAQLQRELHAAQDQIVKLNERASENSDLVEIKKTIFIKETQLLEKESAMKKLAVELDQSQHLVRQLQTDINARNQKLRALQSQMEDTSELDEALKTIKELQLDGKSREQQILSLRGQLEETEQEQEKLKSIISELKIQAGSKDVSIQNLTSDLANKGAQVSALQDQLQTLSGEAESNKQGLTTLEALVSEKDKKIEGLVAKLEDSSELDQLLSKVALFQGQIAEKDASLAKAQKVIADEKSKVLMLVEDGQKPVAELTKLKNLLAQKEAELEELDQKNAKNESSIENLNKQLTEQCIDSETQLETIKNLEVQLQDQSETETLLKQIDALKATNDHQQTQIAEQHTLVDEKKKELGLLGRELGDKDILLEKLQSENKAQEVQSRRDSEALQKLQEQLADTSAIDAVQQQLNEVKSVLNTKQNQLNESHEANVSKQKRIDELEHYLVEKDAGLTQLNNQIKELEQGVFKRSQQIDVLHKQLQDHSEVDNLKQQLGVFQSSVSSKENELSAISNTLKQKEMHINELESSLADRDEQITELVRVDEELSETKQTYTLLYNDYQSSQNKIKDLESHNVGKQKRIEELEQTLENTHEDLRLVREKLDDRSEIESLTSDLVQHQEQLGKLSHEAGETKQLLSIKQQQLDESYHEVQRLRRELEDTSEIDGLKNEMASQASLLRDRESAVSALQAQVNAQNVKLHTLKASAVKPEEIVTLQADIAEKESIIGNLQDENSQLSEKNELIQKQLVESDLKVEALRSQVADTFQVDALTNDIHFKQERIELLLQENDSKHQRLLTLEKSIVLKNDEITTLEHAMSNTSEVDDLKQQINLKTVELNARGREAEVAQARAQELETQKNQYLEEIALLKQELKSNQEKLADTSEADLIRKALNNKTVEHNKLTKMMEKKEGMLNELEAALNHARSELLTLKSTLNDSSELDGLKQQLVEKNSQIDELHQQTINHQDELVTLQSDLKQAIATAQMSSTRLVELEKCVAARDAELNEKKSQVLSMEESSAQREDQMRRLELQLKELESKLGTKQEKVMELQNQVNELTRQSMLASFGSSNVELHPDRGIIYTKEPSKKDNLGDIFGVSVELQEQLNKLGIYKLKQIALWGETQVGYFQNELDFDGNIEREQWPIQAQRLID